MSSASIISAVSAEDVVVSIESVPSLFVSGLRTRFSFVIERGDTFGLGLIQSLKYVAKISIEPSCSRGFA